MLVVTTRERKRLVTLEQMPEDLRKHITISVWADDTTLDNDPLYATNPRIRHKWDAPSDKHLAEKRAQLILMCKDEKLILLDDDLRWYTRLYDGPQPGARKLVNAEPNDITQAIRSVWDLLDNYAHATVSPRNGNNTQFGDYAYNERPLRVLGYRVDVLRSLPEFESFPVMPLMSDFHLQLMLLSHGYPSAHEYRWCQEQANYTQNPGGCAVYRTQEMFAECSQQLADLYPECVRVVQKRGVVGADVAERTDVRVLWKKCFLKGIGQ